MAEPRRATHRKDYKTALQAFGLLAVVCLSPILLVIGMLLDWSVGPMSWLSIGTALSLAFCGLILWAGKGGRDEVWRDFQLPGWTVVGDPGPRQVAELFAGQPPLMDLDGQRVRTLVHGEYAGQRITLLEHMGEKGSASTRLLVHLPGWLPPLRVSPEVEFVKFRDVTKVEDHELNDWFDFEAFDRSRLAVRYAHAVLTPRVMDLLVRRPPDTGFRIRGRFLEIDTFVNPTSLESTLRKNEHLVRVAGAIEPWVHAEYTPERMAAHGLDLSRWKVNQKPRRGASVKEG